MNRRQWNEGNCKLYPMVKETITEYLKRKTSSHWSSRKNTLSFFLFASKFFRFRTLHSNWVRLNLSTSRFIMFLLFANMIKYHQKLFNPFNIANNNTKSTLKLKRKLDWRLELIAMMQKWNPGIISGFPHISSWSNHKSLFVIKFWSWNFSFSLSSFEANFCSVRNMPDKFRTSCIS